MNPNAVTGNRVRKLYNLINKRKAVEKEEKELKTMLKADLGVGVHTFGTYRINITEGERDIVDLDALAAHLGPGVLDQFRKPSPSISATVIRVGQDN